MTLVTPRRDSTGVFEVDGVVVSAFFVPGLWSDSDIARRWYNFHLTIILNGLGGREGEARHRAANARRNGKLCDKDK